MARKHPKSEVGCNSISLNLGNDIVGEKLRHQEQGSSDICAVAREHPHSEGGCHNNSLNAGNGIVGDTPIHQAKESPDVRTRGHEFELSNLHRMSVMTSAPV